MKILVVGAGLYGCTIARLLKDNGHQVEIAEQTNDIGGMCHTYWTRGIEVHKYGPHIFHTDDEWAWQFVNKFTSFNRYEHHVIAKHDNTHFCLPFNKMLLEQFFQVTLKDTVDAQNFMRGMVNRGIKERNIDPKNPKNLEEQAISLVGVDLYEAFIKNYTAKQWNKDPKELSVEIIKRIPVRFNYNMSYYNDQYVGIPKCGYSSMIDRISYGIKKWYNRKIEFNDIRQVLKWFDKVIYTGPLDELFAYSFGKLEWRSLKFETKTLEMQSFQGAPCINYVDADVPHTRIHEYKWYHPELKKQIEQNTTVIQTETPQDWNIEKPRYYPINNTETAELYNRYKTAADCVDGLLVGGRLGRYKYYDMDDTILAARDDAVNWFGINKEIYQINEED